jgi:hypothetical protein
MKIASSVCIKKTQNEYSNPRADGNKVKIASHVCIKKTQNEYSNPRANGNKVIVRYRGRNFRNQQTTL